MPDSLCLHTPKCPSAASSDREAAQIVVAHPEQGWNLLCNGLLLFEDTGELLPDGQVIAAHRPSGTLPPRLMPHALIEGTARRGKTELAAFHEGLAARPASSSWPV